MPEVRKKQTRIKPKRPFFLSFLCIIGFTYTTLFSLLFLLGMLYSTGISGIIDKYMQIYDLSRFNFFMLAIGGFLNFFVLFLGVLMMWKLQPLGFYIYTLASIVFLITEFIYAGIYIPDLIIHPVFIILFSIAFPFKKSKREVITGTAANEIES